MITETTPLGKDFVRLSENISPEETVFFDIETTGFAADVTALYLIGCVFYEGNEWTLTQWFADDKESEKAVLEAFLRLVENKKLLVCYNGSGFDLQYLIKKFSGHCLNFNENLYSILDLYREFAPFKAVLGLDNLKQKTVENFIGINREDKFSGGELIKYYSEYLKARFTGSESLKEIYDILLLHNREDMLGLVSLMKLYEFICVLNDLINGKYAAETGLKFVHSPDKSKHIQLRIAIDCFSPEMDFLKATYRISVVNENAVDSHSFLIIEAPIYTGELKYFYPDYKNYYYLPDEDMAIHKSIASFMREGKREKAKAFNCYTRHKGNFILSPCAEIKPDFKNNYDDKLSYLRLSENAPVSDENIIKYAAEVMKYMVKA